MLNTPKVALVTGASRGIGQAIASALGKVGHIVIGTATTEEGAKKITEVLKQQNIQGSGVMMDVSKPESVEQAITFIKEHFSMPSILVNANWELASAYHPT